MQKPRLRVSIVIPVYNEQDHLAACLEAISRQTHKPLEVIVVDNNSTDKTQVVAEQFPFVTLIKESKQGVVHARDCGFNIAKAEIIGRIDADSILPEDWVEHIENIFQDDSIDAVSGRLHFYDIGWSKVIDSIEGYWRGWMARRLEPAHKVFLFGANMAIRKTSWQRVKDLTCHKKGIHEDLDLALHMSHLNQKVVYDPKLLANLSARRIDTNLLAVYEYAMINPKTYAQHDAQEYKYMYPLIAIVLVNYLPLWLLFRCYDATSQKYSLKLLFGAESRARVNPATYI